MSFLDDCQDEIRHLEKTLLSMPNFNDYLSEAKPPELKVESAAEIQIRVIRKYIQQFQKSLDREHDVGLLLTDFGQSVLMTVTEISYEPPFLMIFRGWVNGRESTLIQNVSRLNFLITTVPKDPDKPHNRIGFSVPSEEQAPTNP